MWYDEKLKAQVISQYGLSSEQVAKIDLYLEMLYKWQKTTQLVSPNTLKDIWQRHIADALQLLPSYVEGAKVLDIGSGGGFPALIISILRSDVFMVMVESHQRKASFLSAVVRELKLNAKVICERAEKLDQSVLPMFDVVEARALSSLNVLFEYTHIYFSNTKCLGIFPKGQGADEEISVAQQKWLFDVEEKISDTDSRAKVLFVRRLSSK